MVRSDSDVLVEKLFGVPENMEMGSMGIQVNTPQKSGVKSAQT